jgi:hypothetical protein
MSYDRNNVRHLRMAKADARSGKDEQPAKAKRTSADRYAWHQCWHGDALLGVMGLSGLARGVLWTILLLMYNDQSALADDDREMARLCNESLKNYRRAKRELLAAGRIVVDEENGILYCERAIRELEAANRLSKAQSERVKKRWRKQKPAKQAALSQRQLCTEVSTNSAPTSNSTSTPITENTEQKLYRSDTNQSQIDLSSDSSSIPASGSAERAAQPPGGGGALTAPKLDTLSETEREAFLADQRAKLCGEPETTK